MPRQVDHDERREAFARATWRVIERSGADRASLRVIAAEAGTTTGALTHYFGSREDLIAFAFGLAVDQVRGRLDEHSHGDSLGEILEELLPLDEDRRLEAVVWLHSIIEARRSPDVAGDMAARYASVRAAIAQRIAPSVRDGLTGAELDEVVDRLLTGVDGITVYALADPARYPPPRQRALAQRLVEAVLADL